jgi:hypothetical protein
LIALPLPIIGTLNLLDLLLITFGFFVLWVVVSIPVCVAGKIVTAGKSTLSDAMIASLFGPIVYAVTLFGLNYVIGPGAYSWGLVLAFMAWVWVFKASFTRTLKKSWLGALAISILAIFVFALMSNVFTAIYGITIPAPFFPHF